MTALVTAPASSAQSPSHPLTRRRRLRSRRRESLLVWIARHAIMIALAFMFLVPFVFIALTAVMSNNQALTSDYWPRSWHFGNFAEVFRAAPMWTYLLNTMKYAGLATIFMLVSSVPAAYALSRFRWRGRNFTLLLVITMMMLPPQVTVVPMYIMWARFHLTGSLWPMILPNLFGDAFSIFLLRQFLITIPSEYTDAARCDGCGEFAMLFRIIIPMSKPAIAATAMFMFFQCWNDYYGPLLYTSEQQSNWPLALGLASFRNSHQAQWNTTMAATLIVMLPVLLVFFFAQRAFVEGVTLTGVKG
jgi:multiple sugar transport system permease protein